MGDILQEVLHVPCHPGNRGGTRRADQIRYLVYHYTGNDGDAGGDNARYYRDHVVQASAHYFVDDDSVTQSVEDLEIAWAVGGKKWTDCPRTGGGSLYGTATNANSLSIELCDTRRDGQLMASEATLERGARLGRALMEKYHIPAERVIRHFDVTGKHCPAYFMDAQAWAGFKERLAAGAGQCPAPAEEVGQKQDGAAEKEKEDMKIFRRVEEVPAWGGEAVEKAIRIGIMKKDDQGLVTLWEPNLQPLVWMDRLGLLDRAEGS